MVDIDMNWSDSIGEILEVLRPKTPSDTRFYDLILPSILLHTVQYPSFAKQDLEEETDKAVMLIKVDAVAKEFLKRV